jgi:hypothetical protein
VYIGKRIQKKKEKKTHKNGTQSAAWVAASLCWRAGYRGVVWQLPAVDSSRSAVTTRQARPRQGTQTPLNRPLRQRPTCLPTTDLSSMTPVSHTRITHKTHSLIFYVFFISRMHSLTQPINPLNSMTFWFFKNNNYIFNETGFSNLLSHY